MKIDFARTRVEITRFLDERLRHFAKHYPHIVVHSIGLWALSFHKVAKVVIHTNDDAAIDLDEEYEGNEFGGIGFDAWWPDLYGKEEEEERYEIDLEPHWNLDPNLFVGDDEINLPLFALIKDIVAGANLNGLKLADDFQLTAQIGSHWLEARWTPGECPETGPLVSEQARLRDLREAGLLTTIQRTESALAARRSVFENEGANTLVFAPDGQSLFSFTSDHRLRQSRLDGQLVREIEIDDKSTSMAFAPDFRSAVSYGAYPPLSMYTASYAPHTRRHPPAVHWNLETGEKIGALPASFAVINCCAFSPGGKLLALGDDDGTLRLCHVQSRRKKATLAEDLAILGDLAFSPDGVWLAWVCNGGPECVVLWHLAEGRAVPIPVEHSGWPSSVAFSPDGKLLATAGTEELNIWDLEHERLAHRFKMEADLSDDLVFHPRGHLLAIGGEDNAMAFFDVAKGERICTVADPGEHNRVRRLAFSPADDMLAATHSGGTIDVWDVKQLCPSVF